MNRDLPDSVLHSSFSHGWRTSSVYTGRHSLGLMPRLLQESSPDRVFVIADSTMPRGHLATLLRNLSAEMPQRVIEVPGGDSAKSAFWLHKVIEDVLHDATRDSVVCSFGGSATSNLAGLVASLIYRGIPFFHIPTTYLSQADGAVGLKQAVNSALSKNAIGVFSTPLFCLNDTDFIATLPRELLLEGMVETYKAFVAFHPAKIPLLEDVASRAATSRNTDAAEHTEGLEELIHESAKVKTSRLSEDPHENGVLYPLEIGHTVAHAVETASGGRIRHGTAVALGLQIETRYAQQTGVLENDRLLQDLRTTLGDLLQQPTRLPASVTPQDVMNALDRDSHRTSEGPRLVLLQDYGKAIEPHTIDRARLERIMADEFH